MGAAVGEWSLPVQLWGSGHCSCGGVVIAAVGEWSLPCAAVGEWSLGAAGGSGHCPCSCGEVVMGV